IFYFFFSSRRRHTRFSRDWSSDVCSSDLVGGVDDREAKPRDQEEHEESETLDLEIVFVEAVVAVARLPPLLIALALDLLPVGIRSEERRVGKECSSRWSTGQ